VKKIDVTFDDTIASPTVAIIILNWNGGSDTYSCLESLSRLKYPNISVLLVDNGSTDESLTTIRGHNWPFSLRIIENNANLGFAEGNNVGIRAALEVGAEFVMLLNNDTEIAPDCIDRLLEAAKTHPDTGIYGPCIFYSDPADRIWFKGAEWNSKDLRFDFPGQGQKESTLPSEPIETDYVCGAAMLFRSEVARKVGLFDPRFFLVYEESDWCFTARRAGYRCLTVPSAKIWHKIGSSFGSEEAPLRTYFSTRNRLLWIEKNCSREELYCAVSATRRSLRPPLNLSGFTDASLAKRIAWSLREYLQTRRRYNADAHMQVRRIAYRDYVARRFGNCPDTVRDLNAAWAARHQASQEV
jgi:GT2 family glycosyltransferase